MSNYQGSVPDTEPARGWLERAACRAEGVDPDLMFPDNNVAGIAQAKAICRPCPVWRECLSDALEMGDNHYGIRGGLRPDERRRLVKGQGTGIRRPKGLPKRTAPQEAPPATLAEAFTRRTARTDDGHVLWYGARQMKFQGDKYSALRVAFVVGHGREPEGRVQRSCGVDCYRSDHLTDGVIRDSEAICGTRAGYQRHKKRDEVACDRCRKANADADRRLRNSGTTRQKTAA